MAVSFTDRATGRFLTSFDQDTQPGSDHCLSIGHPLNGGQFTTFRLGDVVGQDSFGRPAFDLNEATIALADCTVDGQPLAFYTRTQLRDLAAAMWGLYFHFDALLQRPYRPASAPPYPAHLFKL